MDKKKQKLFEMMNKVAGMPLNESEEITTNENIEQEIKTLDENVQQETEILDGIVDVENEEKE